MITKESILDNVDSYTSEELAGYIKSEIVSLEELRSTGELPPPKRKEIESLIAHSEDDDWAEATSADTVDAYTQYLYDYQDGSHRDEARSRIRDLGATIQKAVSQSEWNNVDKNNLQSLQQYRDSHSDDDPHMNECKRLILDLQFTEISSVGMEALIGKITEIDTDPSILDKPAAKVVAIKNALNRKWVATSDILNAIKANNNLLDHTTLLQLMLDGLIGIDDLVGIGIDYRFIKCLNQSENRWQSINTSTLKEIGKEGTEVYFWGIPSSGKTCALGGVLSVANSGHVAKTMSMDIHCQGYAYMNRLANLFKEGDATFLPGSTGFTQTYAMSFDLMDQKNKIHPITLVDLAGEVFKAMYWSNADASKLTDPQKKHLETITSILGNNRSENRKIHFFVIEYGAENRQYDGFPQNTYLNGALQYIDQTGILNKDTDGLYILLSKSDKAMEDGVENVGDIRNYISKGYANFYNGLVKLSQQYEINGGHVDIVPFTLGKVCFKDFCLFDGTDSEEVVKILLERSYALDSGRIGTFKKWFRS